VYIFGVDFGLFLTLVMGIAKAFGSVRTDELHAFFMSTAKWYMVHDQMVNGLIFDIVIY